MTKGELTDLVFIRVLGGQLSADANVYRADISAYLPVAISEVIRNAQFQERAENRADRFPVSGVDESFLTTKITIPVEDTARGLWYVIVPKLLSLPNGWSLSSVSPQKAGASPFLLARSQGQLSAIRRTASVFCWYEVEAGQGRIWFQNEPKCNILVRGVFDSADLEDEDEVAIPVGLERMVIEACVAHFQAQRGLPADTKLDNKDVNNVETANA